MSALPLADSAPETPDIPDNRRITEHDPAVVALKAKTVRRLQASVKRLIRELRPGSGIAQGEAQSQFIQRHVDILRAAYVEAHRLGQRQYYDGVSRDAATWAREEPDPARMARTLAFYAPSVAKIAHEAAVYAAAARVQQAYRASHVAALSDLALSDAQGHSEPMAGYEDSYKLFNPNHDSRGRFTYGAGSPAHGSGRMGSRQVEGTGHVAEHVGGGHHAGGGAGGSGGGEMMAKPIHIGEALELAKAYGAKRGMYLRWSTGKHEAGDKLRPSRDYIEGQTTGKILKGTSALRLDYRYSRLDLEHTSYIGHLYLIRGHVIGKGDDDGEVIVEDATVVTVLKYEGN